MDPSWYLRRLSAMGPAEIVGRVGDVVRKQWWRGEPQRQPVWSATRTFPAWPAEPEAPATGRDRLVAAADRLMDGHAEYFGVARDDLVAPDWAFDPKTGRRAPGDRYSFEIPYRDENAIGDIKQIWEPSRHQHLTVLAAAYRMTGDDRYAHRVADQLKSWWAANPPMRGVHWLSGIELGIRLLSWVWARRLLDGWSGAPGLFEDNPEALRQIWHHQRWLAAFPSRGTSANNHVLAEAAGQLAASCAFDWYPESSQWRSDAIRSLDFHLRANTFTSGLNRELATEYHGLVLELGLAAALEAGPRLPRSTWLELRAMCDALAAIVDCSGRPPRQGDADDGYGLIVDGPDTDRWHSLLATGDALFGREEWWPKLPADDVRTALFAALRSRVPQLDNARQQPVFADAGMTILRSDNGPEIWCRCDSGPHGFLAIAAHAHADALSIEVRHDGVDLLADPGTYCYHGEPEWRAYFRSTLGHNTLQLGGVDQSTSGGPFLWTRHAQSRTLAATPAQWQAEHDGYAPALHRRSVELSGRTLTVVDEVTGGGSAKLAFHLGPLLDAELDGNTARLTWPGRTATMELPPQLAWTAHRGEANPPLGWYSPGFGRREPATTLVGSGPVTGPLTTVLRLP
ncbi:heparinase [Amycolatopsis rubida]|uniref:Heparinase n=1 Tax=Amycolatopsis rubida TaxID=112413 RepID=A0ABX0BTS6_9PSEU|nr:MULTISPECIES: alginate lyase family protein [Amycolatopsis]MYW94025.1 heparinase [Amycolatopsis rubida]NEC59014.1 heparinase [Amycolatopsis rubida]OAP22101.1 Heparinase II/III-like protein [Amycolatopsis sp. M39]